MSVLNITNPVDLENVSELLDRVADELVTNHGWVAEYTQGTIVGQDIERWISKPAADTINGTELVFGMRELENTSVSFGMARSMEIMGSWLSFSDTHQPRSITNVSNAFDAVLTIGAHNFVIGDVVYITGVVDTGAGTMESALNGIEHAVTAISGTTISINTSTNGLAPYSSGGTVSLPFLYKRGCPRARLTNINVPGSVNLMATIPFTQAWVFTPNEVSPFDGTTDVDDVTNELDLTAHGWVTGDLVKYSNGGGTTITGLTNDQIYYVNRIDANTLSLHNTEAEARSDTNRVGLTDTGTSALNELTTYQYCYVVVEVSAGVYRSFGFGESKQLGAFTGGSFFLGNWIDPAGNNDSYDDNLGGSTSPFAGLQGQSNTTGEYPISRIHVGPSTLDGVDPTVDDTDQSNGWVRNGYGPIPGSLPNGGRYGGILPSWHAAGGYRLRITPSQFSGKAIREPLKWYMHVADGTSSDVRPLAELPDLFVTNIRDFDPGTTVVDDVERFFVFPTYSKQVTAPSSSNHGFMIRNPAA